MKILAIHFVRHWLAPVPESLRPSPPVMLDVAIGKRKVCALAVPVSRLMLPQLLAQTHRKISAVYTILMHIDEARGSHRRGVLLPSPLNRPPAFD